MPEAASIRCSTEGFAVDRGRHTAFIAGFDEIVRAIAFKRDEVTTDLLCVHVALANGESLELNEDFTGFEAWIRRIDSLPGVDPNWRLKVIQPPFARNETVLFSRRDQV